MEIFNKILHSYAMYCRKEMANILKCYLIPKKSYGTLSKGAIFFGQPCRIDSAAAPKHDAAKWKLF